MPAMKHLEDALFHELKDLMSAEKQLTRALPKMAKKAQDAQLRQALEQHLEQTKQQVQRLEQAMESMGRKPSSTRCDAMVGIVQEGEDVLEQKGDPTVIDAMIIAAAQKAEHYEIASYGTACTWAKMLGQDKALSLLKQTMDEEEQADQKLTDIATSHVNADAA